MSYSTSLSNGPEGSCLLCEEFGFRDSLFWRTAMAKLRKTLVQRGNQVLEATFNIPLMQAQKFLIASCQYIRKHDQLTWMILQVTSFLYHKNIPENLLCESKLFHSTEEIAIDRALNNLESLGLIRRQQLRESRGFKDHPLIKSVFAGRPMVIDTSYRLAYESALEVVQRSFGRHANKSYLLKADTSGGFLSTLLHAEAVLGWKEQFSTCVQGDTTTATEYQVRHEAAKASLLSGKLRQAEELIRSCKKYPLAHMAHAQEFMIKIDITDAHIEREMGRYRKAQDSSERAVRRFEDLSDASKCEHADLRVSALMIYATTLREQCFYGKAKQIYCEISGLCRQGGEFYKEHGLYAHLCHGSILVAEGRSSEAMEILRLVYKSQQVGGNDPVQYVLLAEIAEAQLRQGDYKLARKTYCDASAGMDRMLTATHPRSLLMRANYGSVLSMTKNHQDARKVLERVLKCQEKAIGHCHPNTLTTRRFLSITLSCQGKYGKAIEQHNTILQALRWASETERQALHPTYYEISKLKADAKRESGRLHGKLDMLKEALDGYEEASKAIPDEGSNLPAWSIWVDLGRARTYVFMSELEIARDLLAEIRSRKSALSSETDFAWLADIQSLFDDSTSLLDEARRRERGR